MIIRVIMFNSDLFPVFIIFSGGALSRTAVFNIFAGIFYPIFTSQINFLSKYCVSDMIRFSYTELITCYDLRGFSPSTHRRYY